VARPTISLCMITRDAQSTLHACLSAVRDSVDEIVIVDSSSDQTRRIAESFGAKVRECPPIADFSAARNESFAAATGDWILTLDADDELPAAGARRLRSLCETLAPDIVGVGCPYHYHVDDCGQVDILSLRLRLVRRLAAPFWRGRVHEELVLDGPCAIADIPVIHRRVGSPATARNLLIYETQRRLGEPFSVRDRIGYAEDLRADRQWVAAAKAFADIASEPDIPVEQRVHALTAEAECLLNLNAPSAAGTCLQFAMALVGPRTDLLVRSAHALRRCGQLAAAERLLRLALDHPLPPPYDAPFVRPAFHTWLPHAELACVLGLQERWAAACEQIDTALAHRPQDERLLAHRQQLLQRRAAQTSAGPATAGSDP
jgi:hypothetical protein